MLLTIHFVTQYNATRSLIRSTRSAWASFLLSIASGCRLNSKMARSSASHELFKDGVRAVLHGWPVLQVNTAHLSDRCESTGHADRANGPVAAVLFT